MVEHEEVLSTGYFWRYAAPEPPELANRPQHEFAVGLLRERNKASIDKLLQ